MHISISHEDQLILEDIKKDLIEIKQTLIEWGVLFLIAAKDSLIDFIKSYEEYSLSNIQKKGLFNILTERAIRFFKLESREEQRYEKDSKKSRKLTPKRVLKKFLRIILFPVYLIIILILLLFKEKQKKNVINSYKT